jgi:hypothetical protein
MTEGARQTDAGDLIWTVRPIIYAGASIGVSLADEARAKLAVIVI